ncbi:pleckstrin homology domain-containing family A member 5 isoform X20 [Callorhinus ursinus]|uniref:Pleckstrin homology domain-containing family A member 5 isoform X13 n=1 Tax=Zalophus californianus TaxID=9704 RepID=A0A6J2D2Y1_ZALCA|nr:pleckstrin homology domain-containing family A member 5 isoform X13 [Zalophus californianus]
MAADLNLEWICSLPRSWTYGITRGGRVFFINEEAKSTTWLHPVTGEAVVTGHRRQSTDLPTGWEEAYTFEGARYYINKKTSEIDALLSHSKLSLSHQLLCVPGTGGRRAEQPVGDGLTCHVWFIVIHLIKEGTMYFYLLRL